mmetsp:Transcript_9940/g.16005  ORF Transcript_9940/g.16005 Transcript_9940/m.16005 type:complete len:279 (-) Transcript_9940:279-1115(-)
MLFIVIVIIFIEMICGQQYSSYCAICNENYGCTSSCQSVVYGYYYCYSGSYSFDSNDNCVATQYSEECCASAPTLFPTSSPSTSSSATVSRVSYSCNFDVNTVGTCTDLCSRHYSTSGHTISPDYITGCQCSTGHLNGNVGTFDPIDGYTYEVTFNGEDGGCLSATARSLGLVGHCTMKYKVLSGSLFGVGPNDQCTIDQGSQGSQGTKNTKKANLVLIVMGSIVAGGLFIAVTICCIRRIRSKGGKKVKGLQVSLVNSSDDYLDLKDDPEVSERSAD